MEARSVKNIKMQNIYFLSNVKMTGDLFDLNEDYGKLNTTEADEAKDVTVSLTGVNKRAICTRNAGTFYEDFKDNVDDDAIMEKHGEVFCETMNGKLAGFPETYEQFKKFLSYAQDFLAIKEMDGMNIAINAYTYSSLPEKPDIGYPPSGYFTEMYDYDTDRVLNIEEKVKRTISKEHTSYQSAEKLCMMMPAFPRGTSSLPKGFDYEEAWFISKRCGDNVGGTHSICEFEKKINLKLSGLCSKSPVDKVYALMEPKFDPTEGNSWADYYRFGTFSGFIGFHKPIYVSYPF